MCEFFVPELGFHVSTRIKLRNFTLGNSLGLRPYFIVYPSSSPNTDTAYLQLLEWKKVRRRSSRVVEADTIPLALARSGSNGPNEA